MLAAGKADVGLSTDLLTVSDSNAQGTDFVIWGARCQKSPFGLLSLADNPINTPQDMVGKTLGGPEGDQVFLDAVLTINGLQAGDYDFVPIGFDATPLVNGKVEGMTAYSTNQPLYLELDGIDNVMVLFADMGMPSYADMLFADRTYLQENHDSHGRVPEGDDRGLGLRERQPRLRGQPHPRLVRRRRGRPEVRSVDVERAGEHPADAIRYGVVLDGPGGAGGSDVRRPAGLGTGEHPDPATIVDLSILDEVHAAASPSA